MNMQMRERRSYVREFVEVPGLFRRTLADAIEQLISVLDQLDADPDMEPECEDEGAQCDDEGEIEPDADLGWPGAGASTIPHAGFFGDGEEDLAAPETSGGLISMGSGRDALTVREQMDRRLARRPLIAVRGRSFVDDEVKRLRGQLARAAGVSLSGRMA